MKFYTNVQMVGDQILLRGYEDGKRFSNRDIYKPTMFVSSKRETKYKTLTGDYVEPIKPGTIKETREFISKYDGVDGFKLYGFERFIYQFISDNYQKIRLNLTSVKLN